MRAIRERSSVRPRVLFLDHAGVLGGAELCLLDIAQNYSDSSKVVLFADGPFRDLLQEVGVATEVLLASRVVGGISRNVNVMRDLQAVPQVLRLAQRVSRLAHSYDVLYANSQKAFVIGALAGRM